MKPAMTPNQNNNAPNVLFPRDKLFLSHIRSLPAAMGWMCVAPAKSNPGVWVQPSLRPPRPPGSVSAGLAQVQSTTRLGTQASLFFIGRGGWVKNLRPGAYQRASFTHGCPSMRALLQSQYDLRADHARRAQNLAKHLSRIWAAFNAFRPQGQT